MKEEQLQDQANPLNDSMNRRQLLRKLGFGSIAIVGSGSLVTLLQGCAAPIDRTGDVSFLSATEIDSLRKICEAILPRTQTPGAIDAGVAEHLSQALAVTRRERQVENFQSGMARFVENYERDTGNTISTADISQLTARINAYLRRYDADPSRLDELDELLETDNMLSNDMLETYFVVSVIDATIWSYFTSELVGENVLRFDPVPGAYDACIDYTPGEHSWSS